jgi:DNA-binding response OmpR family regulator
MKILIVDDSKPVHSYTKICLQELGFADFLDAYNGDEALLALSKEVDLILMDWEMPIKDGATTLRELRAQGIEIPVVVVTTKNRLQDITFMLDLGANDYMMKPFTVDVLNEKIQPFLKKAAAA